MTVEEAIVCMGCASVSEKENGGNRASTLRQRKETGIFFIAVHLSKPQKYAYKCSGVTIEPIEFFFLPSSFICISYSFCLFLFFSFLFAAATSSFFVVLIGSMHDVTFFNFTFIGEIVDFEEEYIVSIMTSTIHTIWCLCRVQSDERIMRIHSGGSFTRHGYKSIGMGLATVANVFRLYFQYFQSPISLSLFCVNRCLSLSAYVCISFIYIYTDRHTGHTEIKVDTQIAEEHTYNTKTHTHTGKIQICTLVISCQNTKIPRMCVCKC